MKLNMYKSKENECSVSLMYSAYKAQDEQKISIEIRMPHKMTLHPSKPLMRPPLKAGHKAAFQQATTSDKETKHVIPLCKHVNDKRSKQEVFNSVQTFVWNIHILG